MRFGDDDETTREVVRRVQEDGTCWLGGTVWQGRAAMRISVSSFRTTHEDVDAQRAAILEAAADRRAPVAERDATPFGSRPTTPPSSSRRSRSGRFAPDATVEELREALGGPLPEEPTDASRWSPS